MELIKKYLIEIKPQEISASVGVYFKTFNGLQTFKHSQEVVEEIKLIADLLKLDMNKCITAAYLHDVGRMVKNEELAEFWVNMLVAKKKNTLQYYIRRHQKLLRKMFLELRMLTYWMQFNVIQH